MSEDKPIESCQDKLRQIEKIIDESLPEIELYSNVLHAGEVTAIAVKAMQQILEVIDVQQD